MKQKSHSNQVTTKSLRNAFGFMAALLGVLSPISTMLYLHHNIENATLWDGHDGSLLKIGVSLGVLAIVFWLVFLVIHFVDTNKKTHATTKKPDCHKGCTNGVKTITSVLAAVFAIMSPIAIMLGLDRDYSFTYNTSTHRLFGTLGFDWFSLVFAGLSILFWIVFVILYFAGHRGKSGKK
jgi:magnesium-transporting ATPase (P-type)